MHPNLLMTIILPFFIQHNYFTRPGFNFMIAAADTGSINPWPSVDAIPLPSGYRRLPAGDYSFATWLRHIALKKDTRVYLYDGRLKRNQSAQFAVLNISVGDKDLQQCADAVMRLRAEYLYAQKRYGDIWFSDNNGKRYYCPPGADRSVFDHYLEKVFTYCGTLSLQKQLKSGVDFKNIQPGDVLVKGGSPGHAVIVMDVAVNASGQTIFLLAQSYMPAQDIHILNNPTDPALSPWYRLPAPGQAIDTPEWIFYANQLASWPLPASTTVTH